MDPDKKGGLSRQRFNEALRAGIPARYSPVAHFACTAGFCAAAVSLGLIGIDGLHWYEFLLIPPSLVFLNIFEWWAHQRVMHSSGKLGFLYRTHTLEHHRLYRWGDMGIQSWREVYYVLIPLNAIAGLILTTAVLVTTIGLLISANAGWIFLIMISVYVLAYEVMHLIYHLHDDHVLKRSRLVKKLAEHHSRHHDPKLMQKWNFNITVPLADMMFGTVAPDSLIESVRSRRTRSGITTE